MTLYKDTLYAMCTLNHGRSFRSPFGRFESKGKRPQKVDDLKAVDFYATEGAFHVIQYDKNGKVLFDPQSHTVKVIVPRSVKVLKPEITENANPATKQEEPGENDEFDKLEDLEAALNAELGTETPEDHEFDALEDLEAALDAELGPEIPKLKVEVSNGELTEESIKNVGKLLSEEAPEPAAPEAVEDTPTVQIEVPSEDPEAKSEKLEWFGTDNKTKLAAAIASRTGAEVDPEAQTKKQMVGLLEELDAE